MGVRGGWGLAGPEIGRGGSLAFDLASVQALHAGFDQRTVSVGKTVGKNEQRPIRASIYLTYWRKR